MKSILYDLYNGHINPGENNMPNNLEYKNTCKKISDETELLKENISKQDFYQLDEILSLYNQCSWMESNEAFSRGFKLAVLLCLEIFCDNNIK